MPVRDLLMSASGASSSAANYIDDFFSTYLYTGNGATGQSINNGIDLAGKGGMVWTKARSSANRGAIYDTTRGVGNALVSSSTAAQTSAPSGYELTSFNSNGFSLNDNYYQSPNANGVAEVSWSFAKQPKFFDIVTWTGNGSGNKTISHSLGSTPGMIIVKCTNNANGNNNWLVYTVGTGSNSWLNLNNTDAVSTSGALNWNPTSTTFNATSFLTLNDSGATYIAYLFASNAGGFGTTGTDNAITCGSYTTNSSYVGPNVNLGYEPQWILLKDITNAGNWYLIDTMRGWTADGNFNFLNPNSSSAESSTSPLTINSTGFQDKGAFDNNATIIYMAIRRPMKPPTSGTSVFAPVVQNCNPSSPSTVTTGFPVDLSLGFVNNGSTYTADADRLRGSAVSYQNLLYTQTTNAEDIYSNYGIGLDSNTSLQDYHYGPAIGSASPTSYWSFSRRPGFFDVVCYTGNGIYNTAILHNLNATPEMVIIKNRSFSNTYAWGTWQKYLGSYSDSLTLNTSSPSRQNGGPGVGLFSATPTSTTLYMDSTYVANSSSNNYVAYLFATVAGVSKIGSYTGTGGTQTINCGFGAGGARFILAKRTNSTGNWFVWDSTNGLTSTSSPYVTLNTTNAQVTGNNGVYAASTGFTMTSTASSTINVNGGSYIFLAIA